jgi:hypothetical protein
MDSTATLVIRIETAMTKLRSELARVEREVARTADSIGKEVGQADSVIGSLGTSLRANLPAIIAEGLVKAADFVGQTLDEASALRAAADASGIAIEQYQRLDYALRQAGLGQGQFDSALDAFLPKLGEALQGSGAAAAAMQRLGVSVRDAGGEVRTTDAVLLDIADGLARVASPAERAGIASRLFGDRAGPEMALALSQGGQAIRDLGKDASVLEEGMVRSADEINKRWQTLTNTIGTGVKGAVLDVVQATMSAVDRIGASLDESASDRRLENMEKALRSGDREDIWAARKDLIDHGEVSYPAGPTRGRASIKPIAPKPRQNSPDTGSLNDPPVQGIGTFDRNEERRKAEAERAAAARKAETDRQRAEQVEAAAEYDGGRDRARERAQAILQDKQAMDDALDQELAQAQKAQEMASLTEKARLIENRLLQEQVAWREKGIPLTETELEQKRALITTIVETQMATKAQAETMEYLEQLGGRAFDHMGTALKEIFVDGESAADSFKKAVSAIISELMQEFIKLAIINPLKNMVFGSKETTLSDVFGGIFDTLGAGLTHGFENVAGAGGTFGGLGNGPQFRAHGGPVVPGQSYIVGEKRPELFVPSVPGVILPRVPELNPAREAAQEAFTYAPTINVDARNSTLGAGEIRSIVDAAVGRSVATMRDMQNRRGSARI